jgi:hypothetical protein
LILHAGVTGNTSTIVREWRTPTAEQQTPQFGYVIGRSIAPTAFMNRPIDLNGIRDHALLARQECQHPQAGIGESSLTLID